jgi:ribonuclease Z
MFCTSNLIFLVFIWLTMRSQCFEKSFQASIRTFRSSFGTLRLKLKPLADPIVPRYTYPVGALRDERFGDCMMNEMHLTTVGTASAVPSMNRGTSCHMLNYNGDNYMFDCGEGTQMQFQRMGVKWTRIKKIFITHCHGDHQFGLPGVLCGMGQAASQENAGQLTPIDIYGPEGTRAFVRASIALSQSRICVPHRIHELKNVPYFHQRDPTKLKLNREITIDYNSGFGEKLGGRDYFPDKNNVYHLTDQNETLQVTAAPLQHTVPSVGYVIQEKDRAGKLNVELLEPFMTAQADQLRVIYKDFIRSPRGNVKELYKKFKEMQPNQTFTFPEGQTFTRDQIIGPDILGRKVVILGDTCNSGWIANIAMDCDLLVHEATNAFFFDLDYPKVRNYLELEKETVIHGHSTPQMAAKFASEIRARQLVLTHFSPRYSGGTEPFEMEQMWKIEHMARIAANGTLDGRNDIVAAWDFMTLPIPRKYADGTPVSEADRNLTAIRDGEEKEEEE